MKTKNSFNRDIWVPVILIILLFFILGIAGNYDRQSEVEDSEILIDLLDQAYYNEHY